MKIYKSFEVMDGEYCRGKTKVCNHLSEDYGLGGGYKCSLFNVHLYFGYGIEKCDECVAHTENQDMKYLDIMKAWNNKADEFNQWDSLSEEEKITFTLLFIRE